MTVFPYCSIVIPVHQSSATLRALHARLLGTLAKLRRKAEILYVDDCSTDGSWKILGILRGSSGVRLRRVRLRRRLGQHGATLAGLRLARGQRIVTMDDDLQHAPEEVPQLLKKLDQGHDLVYGVGRNIVQGPWRTLASKAGRMLLKRIAPQLKPEFSAFRAMGPQVLKAAFGAGKAVEFLDGPLSRHARKIAVVKVVMAPRREGKSGYGFRRLAGYFFSILKDSWAS